MDFDLARFMARLRVREAAPPWGLSTALGLMMGYFVLRVAALAFVSVLVDPNAVATGAFAPLTVNLAGIVTGLASLVLISVTLRRVTGGEFSAALRLGEWRGAVLLVMLLSLGMAILIDFVPLLFGTIGLPVALQGMAAAEMPGWGAAALLFVVVAPLVEMTLILGVLYPALAARLTNIHAILFSALAYAVIQVFDSPADGVLWITALLTGLYLSTLRAYQQSTRPTVVAAAMVGLFALFKALRLFL